MGKELNRLNRRKKTIEKINSIFDSATSTLIIHYSCESFYNIQDGRTPRITSIAVRNLASGQTDSFSIHQFAEIKAIPQCQISEHYDELEKEMLDAFFAFVNTKLHCDWVHWNMRDVNYGFPAIEHRYRVLRGTPIQISEDKKIDLSRFLINLYGVGYVKHPRLESLMTANCISNKDFMTGAKEATAFESMDFVKLHRSTLRKVDTLANILERTANKTLTTNTTWMQQNGFTPEVIVEWAKENWVTSALLMFATIVPFVFWTYGILKDLVNR